MKFGRITYNEDEHVNIGDWCQTFAVDNIYKKLNIKPSDIINIERNKLSSYKGEKVVLILQGYFDPINKNEFVKLSDDIIPLYFGFRRTTKKNIEQYVSSQNIIGCRDEGTYNLFKKLGYKAFISGCLTITLDKRDADKEYDDIYLVDIPNSVKKYIPLSLKKKKIHYVTHEIHNITNSEEYARNIYDDYKNNAALVVTSRLHCAIPCIAMGIPTILVREYYDDRYAWCDKIIRLYDSGNFSEIDWNPQVLNIEEIKDCVLNAAKKSLEEINSAYSGDLIKMYNKIHQYYLNRERAVYKTPFLTQSYLFLYKYTPHIADFIRENMLRRFTVLGDKNDFVQKN